MGKRQSCKAELITNSDTAVFIDAQGSRVFEERTSTGIRLTSFINDITSLAVDQTFHGHSKLSTFLPVVTRTTPSLTLKSPEVQALLAALDKVKSTKHTTGATTARKSS
jgi:hypothetical protein